MQNKQVVWKIQTRISSNMIIIIITAFIIWKQFFVYLIHGFIYTFVLILCQMFRGCCFFFLPSTLWTRFIDAPLNLSRLFYSVLGVAETQPGFNHSLLYTAFISDVKRYVVAVLSAQYLTMSIRQIQGAVNECVRVCVCELLASVFWNSTVKKVFLNLLISSVFDVLSHLMFEITHTKKILIIRLYFIQV